MILHKWNYKTRTYDKYEVPNEWDVTLFTNDMKKIVSCVQCGIKLEYGMCFTSKEVHTECTGFGYPVCSKCYEAEMDRNIKNKGTAQKIKKDLGNKKSL